MLASYFLSRTVVPTMAKFLLVEHDPELERQKRESRNPFIRFQLAFEHRFEQLRRFYHGLLSLAVARSSTFLILFLLFCVGSFALLYPWLGQDFFPSVDAGQFKLHVRARTGTRIEETARLCDQIDNAVRREIPARELVTIIDNIGIPYSGLNLSYGNSGVVGTADADITVSLTKDHRPTNNYVEDLRKSLAKEFPGVTFYSLPVDMTTQILNFGLPAPIDIQVVGQNAAANHEFAEKLMQEIKYVPGTADLRIQQPFN
jgi:multidrug efflux pump subunit AcrB